MRQLIVHMLTFFITMKHILLSLIILSTCLGASGRVENAVKWNDDWRFLLGDSAVYANTQIDDSTWRQVSVPHDWSREAHASPYLASCTGYLPGGVGWYRKHFSYTANPDKPIVKVYFEGIYNRSDIYLNGHRIGGRPNGYISTEYDLTPWLIEGDNVIAVRVDHSRYADSRWYTGSGIYRDVWLYSKPRRHIALWGATYRADIKNAGKASLHTEVYLSGECSKKQSIEIKLFDQNKNLIFRKIKTSTEDTVKFDNTITNPRLWSLDDPYLYSLQATLLVDGHTVDSEVIPVGLRSISFDPDHGFALNGKSLKIKGVCLHHDAGVLGAAVPPAIIKQRLMTLKEIGVNAIRCSHNPQAPVFYSMCDILGLMVMDEGSDEWEFPKRKWVEGWNVGTPSFDGTYDFFDEWIERDVTDMVRRDRVHPSIILWSVGNEVDYPNDPYSHPVLDGIDDGSGFTQPMFGGYNPNAPNAERIGKIAQRLASCIRSADSSRPVTGALAGVVMSNCTEYPEAIDVVGYNYTESRYEQDHRQYPNRVIYGSENRSDYNAWVAVRDNEFISGQFIWTGADYLGESGRWPSRGLGTGLVDFANFMKPRGYFRQSLWSDEPMAYIGTYNTRWNGRKHDHISIDAPAVWNYDDGDTVRVVCYTNQPIATLYLNDRIVGETKPWNPDNGVIYWDIPYIPGTLTVKATDVEGIVTASANIHTVTAPREMTANITDIDGNIATVTVELFDDNGHLCTLADNLIQCNVTGGRLLGLENGNNRDMTDYSAHERRVHNGRLKAYIEFKPGTKCTIQFKNQLLGSQTITL